MGLHISEVQYLQKYVYLCVESPWRIRCKYGGKVFTFVWTVSLIYIYIYIYIYTHTYIYIYYGIQIHIRI